MIPLLPVIPFLCRHGDSLRGGWANVMDLVVQLYRRSLLPDTFCRALNGKAHAGRQSRSAAAHTAPSAGRRVSAGREYANDSMESFLGKVGIMWPRSFAGPDGTGVIVSFTAPVPAFVTVSSRWRLTRFVAGEDDLLTNAPCTQVTATGGWWCARGSARRSSYGGRRSKPTRPTARAPLSSSTSPG